MRYDWVLFDADQTLFSFYSYPGLKNVFAKFGLEFNEEDYKAYQKVNRPLWVDYQDNKITAEELKEHRFAHFAQMLGVSGLELNTLLMNEMSYLSQPLEGVLEMLEALYGKAKMAIITNGFQVIQIPRLIASKTDKFFEFTAVSEMLGQAKPHNEIFEKTFAMMNCEDKKRVLMVGDTLESDILGGNNFGFDTCYFNPKQKENNTEIKATYEIQDIRDLVTIVLDN